MTADCTTLCAVQWDASGSMLAVLPAGCSFIYTWSADTKELQKLETDFRVSATRAQLC